MDDREIVQLFWERNEEAVRAAAQKYGSHIRGVAYQVTRSHEIAEECENDTYLELWNRIPPDRPETYLESYVLRIGRCIAIDRCRKDTRLKRAAYLTELTEEIEMYIPSEKDVAEELEVKQLGEAINRFVLGLSEEKQVMFACRYYYLDSIAEIAERLSVSSSKVKVTLLRIRRSLRDYLKKEGYTV